LIKLRLAAVILAWLSTLLVVAWLVLAGREDALERGQRSTAAFAALVEQKVAGAMRAVHLTLASIDDAYDLRHPSRNDPAFQRLMARRLSDLPAVRAIFIIGADGRLIQDTDYPSTPDVSLADRAYFRGYAEERRPYPRPDARPEREEFSKPMAIWPPMESRSGAGWFVPVTLALAGADAFDGVIVAALEAAKVAEHFRSLDLGGDYLVALFHSDSTLIASHPPVASPGTRFPHLQIFQRLPAPRGTFWTDRSLSEGKRAVSYRVVGDLPLVVHVSRGRDDILEVWSRTATGAAVAMALLTAYLWWLIARLTRDRARRERMRERRMQAEKMEALGRFTGGIAHDFANLLSIVSLNAAALREGADPGAREHALGMIERTVQEGMRTIDRLLSFARRKPLDVRPMCLKGWLDAARPLLVQAAGPRVALAIEAPAELPWVLCDGAELDMALVNLVVNARDAMSGSGRIDLRVFVCEHETDLPKTFTGKPAPYVCIAVQDNGPGMTDEVRRRALEPFYTTKGNAGTGLGLSQVYGFVRQLGGHLTLDPAPGGGTVVHLYLPIVKEPPQAP
jgi:signal transduction histidine kinase